MLPQDTWGGPWASFVEEHRDWWGRIGGHGPIYALPEPIIEALTRDVPSEDSGHRASKALISETDERAERFFSRLAPTSSQPPSGSGMVGLSFINC